jgi:hypothetical protein
MKKIPDQYVIHATIPRELYEDKPALSEALLMWWRQGIEACGGEPVDESLVVTEGAKQRGAIAILPWEDEEGWDAIRVRAVGKAYRYDSEP